MKRHIGPVAALMISLQTIALPVLAADVTTVKVALTDISSAMGMGPAGQGYGLMGPGMMAGMMAVRTDHSSVKASTIHFDVTNWSQGVLHELIIVAVDNPQAALPYDYSKAKVAEDQVKILGDSGDLQPGASYVFDLALAPGTYLLFCNVPDHYAAGMVTPLTVTP
jgi:uncharacterized cupredoxin-like copper-binding protein